MTAAPASKWIGRAQAFVVRVSRALDVATSPPLAAVLAGAAAGGAVAVDLSGVTLVDPRSVGVIAAAHQRLGSRHARAAPAPSSQHYYIGSVDNCANAGTIVVTILAGPLNYVGVNPKVASCRVPQPSE